MPRFPCIQREGAVGPNECVCFQGEEKACAMPSLDRASSQAHGPSTLVVAPTMQAVDHTSRIAMDRVAQLGTTTEVSPCTTWAEINNDDDSD